MPYYLAPKFYSSSPNSPPIYNSPDDNARSIVYVAFGSHGMWSSVGNFSTVPVLSLLDQTSDGGVYWDTQNSLTTINYPDNYSGNFSWLNYHGVWGNKGNSGCWWHGFAQMCDVADGPRGPLRPELEGAANIGRAVAQSEANPTLTSRDKTDMSGPLSVRILVSDFNIAR
jgi:hypothetical protein